MLFGKLHDLRASAAIGTALLLLGTSAANATKFRVTNMVSDGSVAAPAHDSNLINPWGIATSPKSPFWVANNGTGTSTLYNTAGTVLPLVVTIPGPANPTGIVFNGSPSSFTVSSGGKSGSAAFIYSTEGGTIAGWSPGVNPTNAIQVVDNSALGAGAVYKGLAIGTSGGSSSLYATDFRNGLVEQFDSGFNLVRSFTDASVAPGYAPFGAQVFGDHLFVTYALKDEEGEDDVSGPGHGYVDEFALDGTLVRQLVAAGGEVDSPWGLAIAPSSFGSFAGDLLVGNFGDGTISGFDLTTGAFEGRLLDEQGNPIMLGDLWGLIAGNGAAGGDTDKIYFTAGVSDEAHGLFGRIAAVPEPASWMLMLGGFGAVGGALRSRRKTSVSFG